MKSNRREAALKSWRTRRTMSAFAKARAAEAASKEALRLDLALDRPAYASITSLNPFPPLPAEFKGSYLGLRVSFYYNRNADVVHEGANLSCPSDYVSEAPFGAGSSDLVEAGTLYRNGTNFAFCRVISADKAVIRAPRHIGRALEILEDQLW